MEIEASIFRYEYDLNYLQKIVPRRQNFSMLVTPRYVISYQDHGYENLTAKIIQTYTKEDSIFVDVGAHYGFYSLLIAKNTKVKRVLSFEPNPTNFEILCQNIQLNGLSQIEASNLAVSDAIGVREFKITEASDSSGFYDHPLSKTIEQISIQTISLDFIFSECNQEDIFIKIDAEGHEIAILNGMNKLVSTALPRLRLVVEYNPKLLKLAGHEPLELIEKLFSLGFQVYLIDEEKQIIQKIQKESLQSNSVLIEMQECGKYSNLLCLPEEQALNIVFFSHSGTMYGAQRSLLEMASYLIKKGTICTVIIPQTGDLDQQLEQVGAIVLRCPYNWWAFATVINTENGIEQMSKTLARLIPELMPYLHLINPDVILTNTSVIPWGAMIAFLIDKPHVWYIHEFGDLDHGLFFLFPISQIGLYIRESSNVILCSSNSIKNHFFGPERDHKVNVMYPTVNMPLIASNTNTSYFLNDKALHLAIIGAISEGKGQLEAVQAVKILKNQNKNVELLIVGEAEPNYYEILDEYIKTNELQSYIRLLGYQTNPRPIYEQADIILVCSRCEGFGRVTLEAMVLEKPVVATKSCGTLELIEDGISGLLYTPGNPEELAEKILYLIHNPDKRLWLGKNARKKALKILSISSRGQRKLYKLLLTQKGQRNSSQGEFIKLITTILEKIITTQSQQLIEINSQKNEYEKYLRDIQNSTAWRIIQIMWQIRLFLFPRGSKREYFARRALHLGRRIYGTFRSLKKKICIRPRGLNLSQSSYKWEDYLKLRNKFQRLEEEQVANWHPPTPKIISCQIQDLHKIAQSLIFPKPSNPRYSIVIPVRDNTKLLVECLLSIQENTPSNSYEVIIVEDHANEETLSLLRNLTSVKVIHNDHDFGFGNSCNLGAKNAQGEYLVFLNDDTQVLTKNWLAEMTKPFLEMESVGCVGPKILYPNGKLQEAGAIVNLDATTEMVGYGDNPGLARYNYTREVDYVSATCMMIKKDVFDTINGFDPVYAPAYYEDVDLCMKLRSKGLKIIYTPNASVIHHLSATSSKVWGEENKLRLVARNRQIFLERWQYEIERLNNVKIIAFYLPQYHPIPENDLWWGKGFTEWHNVARATPMFKGHTQPNLPADLGFYDLRVIEVMEQQAELAKRYGIDGFCYYYYWFHGKRLLELPLERILKTNRPDFPFCLCWANENWTRRWDGKDNEILIAQAHSEEDDLACIKDLSRYLMHPNYIRVKNRPLLLIYRVDLFPNFKKTAQIWRDYCRKIGIGEIMLAMVESFDFSTQKIINLDDYGVDRAVEFPPHGLGYPFKGKIKISRKFLGILYDYHAAVINSILKPLPNYTKYRTVMPRWDNTPRRQNRASIFVNSSPGAFQAWLEKVIRQTREQNPPDDRIVFINAWNEWGEGNYLEPDQRFGHDYLAAVLNAKEYHLLSKGLDYRR